MTPKRFSIELMRLADLSLAIEWAAAEGWNPGLHDAACFFRADPTGFWVGRLAEEPIAALSAVKYGNSFGFLGFYLVKPEYRGQGYGLQLWNAVLSTLTERTVGLDGVLAQQENYRKSGFQLAHRNIRYAGIGGGEITRPPEIVDLVDIDFETIAAYDRPFFPDDRTQFLHSWINQPASTALGILQNGRLAGYGVIRACRLGHKIGPLFADDSPLAETLFVALKATVAPGSVVYLDVPELNQAAVSLAQKYGMNMVFETARMYTQTPPLLPYDRWYGVTTFELG